MTNFLRKCGSFNPSAMRTLRWKVRSWSSVEQRGSIERGDHSVTTTCNATFAVTLRE